MRRSVQRTLLAMLVVGALTLGLGGGSAIAGRSHGGTQEAVYTWHVGDDFLTKTIGAPEGSKARADNGDILAIEATGAFTLDGHAASGGGTFTHYHAATGQISTGTLQVIAVESFTSYGPGTPQGAPANWFGGRLTLHVLVTPNIAPAVRIHATLTITCVLGNPPPGAQEGITPVGSLSFDEIIPGSKTAFVRI